MNKQWMQFAIGMFTIIAFFALATMIIWFGELQIAFTPRRQYYVTFTNAQGAEPKAPVRRAGMRIGEISKVEYDEKSSLVIVTIVIEGTNQLREHDEPRLRSSILGGDGFLDIETDPKWRGVPDRKPIPPESTLEGRPPLDIGSSAEAAGTVIPNANRTLDELSKTSQQWTEVGERTNRILATNERELNLILNQSRDSVERLNTTLESINNTLDKKTQANIRVTAQNLADTSNDLRPLIENSRDTIKQISNTTAKLDEVAANLQAATKPLAQRSDSTIRNLDETSRNLNLATADMVTLVNRFQNSDGTLRRILDDPKLYQHLDEAALKLDAGLADLQVILRDMTVFSDKIARHPGELGVQGVLTRDSGSKFIPPSELEAERPHRRVPK